MALPTRRHSKSRTKKRRTHDKLNNPAINICPQCNEPKRPHYVCSSCGFYSGREVVSVEKN